MYDRNITEYFSAIFGNFRKMFGDICLALGKFWKVFGNFGKIVENIAIAAAASEPEENERGSSQISRRLHYRGLQSLFLLNARDCGYARMEALGCAVVCVRNCGYARMEDLGCAVVCRMELWLCANGKI